ncbi:hypothetical protein H0H93_013394 [Arthromyces matolae]|nr:hypothetical protein H0H93_013394 [Arthromyces matolae]
MDHFETHVNATPQLDSIRISPEILHYIQENVNQPVEFLLQRPPALHHPSLTPMFSTVMDDASAKMDVWTSPTGLVVNHGYTLSESVPFTDVCLAIGNSVGSDDWPVLVSLECHVNVENQPELVRIMRETWGSKLLDGPLEEIEGRKVTPNDLKGRIVLMVEYHPDKTDDTSADALAQQEKPQETEGIGITEELALLGFYARSMKPSSGWLEEKIQDPKHIVINASESTIMDLLPTSFIALLDHAEHHLRRIYPRGTRIGSSNLSPIQFWRSGAHVVSLNWQHYDHGMQINEAMFVGSPGWVVRPSPLRNPEAVITRKRQFEGKIVGISGCASPSLSTTQRFLIFDVVPPPDGREGMTFSVYLRAQLFSVDKDLKWCSKSIETKDVPGVGADVIWDETWKWDFEDDELVFVRLLIMEEKFGKDNKLNVFCARVGHLYPGWHIIRMLNMKGKASGATVLVSLNILDSEP